MTPGGNHKPMEPIKDPHPNPLPKGEGVTASPLADSEGVAASSTARPVEVALLASVFVIAACGLLYELAAGAIAVSYTHLTLPTKRIV